MVKILGVSSSLRNARFGADAGKIVDELKALATEAEMTAYLERQTKARAEDFMAAGRAEGLPFDQIYRNLVKQKGNRGLSNSEAALAAGLWGAHIAGGEIAYVSLSRYFPFRGPAVNLDELKAKVLEADGIMISSPVYFGDRGSPTHEFMELLRRDKDMAKHVRNRLYAGIAVGAKRNGGQETTLIYQMIDMVNLSMLAVGNDSKTTSQYGGTAHAGDVGTLYKDAYGINTSIGTGRRLATVGRMLEHGVDRNLTGKANIQIWLLQDGDTHRGRDVIEKFMAEVGKRNQEAEFKLFDFTEAEIDRCIACDICPTDLGPTDQYRCVINSTDDLFKRHHAELIKADAILLAAYSPSNRDSVRSVYQRFIERTRYLRRDDYALGDRLSAPFVISEIDAQQNLHIRMLTSLVRHHHVLHHPLIGREFKSDILNWDSLVNQGESFAANAVRLTKGRLALAEEMVGQRVYNPVGYEISAAKVENDKETGRTGQLHETLRDVHAQTKRKRIGA